MAGCAAICGRVGAGAPDGACGPAAGCACRAAGGELMGRAGAVALPGRTIGAWAAACGTPRSRIATPAAITATVVASVHSQRELLRRESVVRPLRDWASEPFMATGPSSMIRNWVQRCTPTRNGAAYLGFGAG